MATRSNYDRKHDIISIFFVDNFIEYKIQIYNFILKFL